jgi:hypothetical protein
MSSEMLAILLPAALLGWLAGIGVNLLADYLPARRHVREAARSPFSNQLPPPARFGAGSAWQWSGLVAFLSDSLGRKATFTRGRLWRGLLVELALILLFCDLAARYGLFPFYYFFLAYAALFVLLALMDIEGRWIAGGVVYTGYAIAIAESVFAGRVPLWLALRGGLIMFALLLGIFLLGGLLAGRGRTPFGFGDVQLGGMCGLILGLTDWVVMALVLAMLSGGVAALGLWLWARLVAPRLQKNRKRRWKRALAIPYAPHLLLATGLILLDPNIPLLVLNLFRR